ncbi:MAG TPA: hypothetical protein HA343_06265 [Methanomassiliicoccales archaeon]|nr:hypothetical protein [Methanomassiliicoccales archaeon]
MADMKQTMAKGQMMKSPVGARENKNRLIAISKAEAKNRHRNHLHLGPMRS